jgi:hypothetical protein
MTIKVKRKLSVKPKKRIYRVKKTTVKQIVAIQTAVPSTGAGFGSSSSSSAGAGGTSSVTILNPHPQPPPLQSQGAVNDLNDSRFDTLIAALARVEAHSAKGTMTHPAHSMTDRFIPVPGPPGRDGVDGRPGRDAEVGPAAVPMDVPQPKQDMAQLVNVIQQQQRDQVNMAAHTNQQQHEMLINALNAMANHQQPPLQQPIRFGADDPVMTIPREALQRAEQISPPLTIQPMQGMTEAQQLVMRDSVKRTPDTANDALIARASQHRRTNAGIPMPILQGPYLQPNGEPLRIEAGLENRLVPRAGTDLVSFDDNNL